MDYNVVDLQLGSNATIGRAVRTDGGYIIDNPGESLFAIEAPSGLLSLTQTQSRPDFGNVSSINEGFYNASANIPGVVAFACAAGNCTRSAFISAAVYNSCKDISNMLNFNGTYGAHNGRNVSDATNIMIEGPYSVFLLPGSEIKNWNGLSGTKEKD
ncbi:hypothetical protein G6011_04629 [Alternaria panax]|uniref:Uncharacterized protein n=1 Tax=Alternaria panax TaxID=48097 RepID=A0AAD4IHG2_9PLEO|nr:hypothetical protein G6011_04629 [Alternaria panax]